MNSSEMVSVIEQYNGGFRIEERLKASQAGIRKWKENDNPAFNFEKFDYRVQKKKLDFDTEFIPITFALNEYGKIIMSNNIYQKMEHGKTYMVLAEVSKIKIKEVD